MSVRSAIRRFPPGLVPVKLRHEHPGAANEDENFEMWTMGEGAFEESPIHPEFAALILRPDKGGHGTVGPLEEIELDQFQQSLAATRSLWSLVK